MPEKLKDSKIAETSTLFLDLTNVLTQFGWPDFSQADKTRNRCGKLDLKTLEQIEKIEIQFEHPIPIYNILNFKAFTSRKIIMYYVYFSYGT